jgi:hypothetical protein
MSPKTIFYISVIVLALLLLTVAGWIARGTQAFADETIQSPTRPRFA